jgi:RimJ/RimL family protein N-acetyltransferase
MVQPHHRFPNYQQNMQEYFDSVIKSKENLVLAIIDTKTDEHIGNVSLQNINLLDKNAEVAIIIGNKNFWGKGIGEEACRLIIAHGFTQLGLHRMYFGTSGKNKSMQKIGDKIGFKKEGESREAQFKNGEFDSIVHYGLLAHEFKA